MRIFACLAGGICLFLVASCAHPQPERKVAADSVDPSLELGEIWDPAVNGAQTARILSVTQSMLATRAANDTLIRRDAHPKHHGCVTGSFQIDSSSLPAQLRVGVFAPNFNGGRPLQAWVRLSNGNPDGATTADIIPDIRGMAIKLINVPNTPTGTQDFVMLTDKEFFTQDGADYEALHNALSSDAASDVYFAGHPTELKILLAGNKDLGNPLQGEYFSSVPYKLGPQAMKFKATPCPGTEPTDHIPLFLPNANYLRANLIRTMKAGGACYQFSVEPNNDLANQPVENPMIPWDESKSPYKVVATLTLPGGQNTIDSPAQLNLCENLSFNPWHTLPDTRPVGQINRMRAVIYPAISGFRHSGNHVPILEPTSLDPCNDPATAALCSTPLKQ